MYYNVTESAKSDRIDSIEHYFMSSRAPKKKERSVAENVKNTGVTDLLQLEKQSKFKV